MEICTTLWCTILGGSNSDQADIGMDWVTTQQEGRHDLHSKDDSPSSLCMQGAYDPVADRPVSAASSKMHCTHTRLQLRRVGSAQAQAE